MTDVYSPGVRAMLDDPSRVPPELTLFFHNKKWTDLVPPYAHPHRADADADASSVPLFQRIRDRHAGALDDLRDFLASWDALEAAMLRAGDEARWAGVKARFEQQMNDAVVFSEVIMGYYRNISGLAAGR
jgi:alpha-glucuronidase